MTIKSLLKPNKYNVIIFIILFAIVFFIPYIKSTPTPDAEKLIMPGHYPLIFIFLASLVVLMDLLTGIFVLRDFLFFSSFLISFLGLYLFACIAGWAILKRGKLFYKNKNNSKNSTDFYKDKYVLNLDEKKKSSGQEY